MKYTIPVSYQDHVGQLTPLLSPFLSPARVQKMQYVAAHRSRGVLSIFENTHHAHNISAILRSMDAFGFLDCFFLYSNPEIRFRVADAIDRGASQWLMPARRTSVAATAEYLIEHGYRIALVTRPDFSRTHHHYRRDIPSFASSAFRSEDFLAHQGSAPIALVFGSELLGIDPAWHEYAHMYVSVDMVGFCESLNVSVCAAILFESLRRTWGSALPLLSTLERTVLLEYWMARDYVHARTYITQKHPELVGWFDFVVGRKFYEL